MTSEDPSLVIFWRGLVSVCLAGPIVILKSKDGNRNPDNSAFSFGVEANFVLLRSLCVNYALYLMFSVLCMGECGGKFKQILLFVCLI